MAVPFTLPGKLRGNPEPNPNPEHSPAGANQRYSVEPITSAEELSRLQEDWNRLSEASEDPNVFMTFDWSRAWNQRDTQEDRNGRRRLNVLVLRKDGAIAGISPLVRRKVSRWGFGVRKVEFLGTEGDYNDLALGSDLAGLSRAIVDFLAETQDQWDLVDLRDLRATGNTLALIEDALSHTKLRYRIVPEKGRYPYLLIDAPWSVMVGRLSPSARHTLRKKQRRLERMRADGLRVRIIENPHEEPGLLQKLMALEGQKRVDGELSQPFIAAYPEVFQSLFDTLALRGWVYIALMEIGDRPVAWRLGFRCGKRLWDYSTAYDHSFARFSPGTMLVPAVLDYGYLHGYCEHDFLRGEEAYKMRWATGFHQNYRLLIWGRRWTSRARAWVYLDLKTAVNRLAGKGE
jgi:CelD/BcsL family acetyltransferase involved in cellulose biosynthesis